MMPASSLPSRPDVPRPQAAARRIAAAENVRAAGDVLLDRTVLKP
jgi:hypothetical protein